MSFINNNYDVIIEGLYAMYSNDRLREENSKWYLTHQQIDGIMEYIDDLADEEFNITMYIDNVIVNGYGFNDAGEPIEPEEA